MSESWQDKRARLEAICASPGILSDGDVAAIRSLLEETSMKSWSGEPGAVVVVTRFKVEGSDTVIEVGLQVGPGDDEFARRLAVFADNSYPQVVAMVAEIRAELP